MVSPKAWSLGSPALIGHAVWITESAKKKANDKEKTMEDENLEKETAKYQGLLDKAKAGGEKKLDKLNAADAPEKDLLSRGRRLRPPPQC